MTLKNINREFKSISVIDLVPHPSNYNIGDLGAIGESMDTNGWYGVVLVRDHPTIPGKYQILAGEHRWKEAIEKDATEVDCVIVDTEDEVHAARILLSDNETAKRSKYDTGKLDELLETIGSIDGTGLHLDDLADHEDRQKEIRSDSDDDDSFVREYGVIVLVPDEQTQRSLYEEFKGRGLQVRVASI